MVTPIDSIDRRAWEDFRRFGDRTSSFMSLHPSFRSFHHESAPLCESIGRIQFIETSRARIAAAEPLMPTEDRARAFEAFAKESRSHKKRALMLPVSEKLSAELVARGCHRLQIGAEPIFDLEEYFNWDMDPLDTFPRARSLKRRDASVSEVQPLAFASDPEFRRMMDEWLASRKTAPLCFLSFPDPWFAPEARKFFAVTIEGRTCGFVSVAPIHPKNACYLADIICSRPSKSGTTELLIIETMRHLYQQGWREARLGIAPLALRSSSSSNSSKRFLDRALDHAFQRSSRFYNFKSLYEFKTKFNPTRWVPLYLVSDRPVGWSTLVEIIRAHLPASSSAPWRRWLRPEARDFSIPLGKWQWISRLKITLSLSALVLILHALRVSQTAFAELFTQSQFLPMQWNALPMALGPFFHNTLWHLLGDTSTLILFAGAVELIAGSALAFASVGAGLWLSNPATVLLLDPILRNLGDVEFYHRFLSIPDVGASNGVYAAAGALAALLASSRAILFPLALNAIFYTLISGKILALHHLVALGMGFAIARRRRCDM